MRTTKIRVGPPKLLSLPLPDVCLGFRSVFQFPPDVAAHIEETHSTAGLSEAPVYCDMVFVDFDNAELEAAAATYKLDEMGIGYCLYDSGGRSKHLHIRCNPIEGAWVPSAVKSWVKTLMPGADLTFYHQAGMFRLTGTVHDKTGRVKALLLQKKGGLAYITQKDILPAAHVDLIDEPRHVIAKRLRQNLFTTKEAGHGQHIFLSCMLSKDMAKLGIPENEALDILYEWNMHMAIPPLDEHEIDKRVREAYLKYGSVGT